MAWRWLAARRSRLLLLTLFVAAYLQQDHRVDAKIIAGNFFADAVVDSSSRSHRRLASGRAMGSPFGSGCVGTSSVCGTALSNADRTERSTLHREAPPMLWQVKEDMEWERMLAEARPGTRLERFFARLAGDEGWAEKLGMSQEELVQRMRRQEREATETDEELLKLRMAMAEAAQRRVRTSMGWKAPFYDMTHLVDWSADRDSTAAARGGEGGVEGGASYVERPSDGTSADDSQRAQLPLLDRDDFHRELRQRFTKEFDYEATAADAATSSSGSGHHDAATTAAVAASAAAAAPATTSELVIAPWSWQSSSKAALPPSLLSDAAPGEKGPSAATSLLASAAVAIASVGDATAAQRGGYPGAESVPESLSRHRRIHGHKQWSRRHRPHVPVSPLDEADPLTRKWSVGSTPAKL